MPGRSIRCSAPAIGNRIYGCDDCLAACPWNKFAQTAREAKLVARPDLRAPSLGMLGRLDEAAFRALFSGSPIKRIGHSRFLRNVLIAIGNSGDASLGAVALERLSDASPLVRGAAAWAAIRLFGRPAFLARSGDSCRAERDPDVRAEWELA